MIKQSYIYAGAGVLLGITVLMLVTSFKKKSKNEKFKPVRFDGQTENHLKTLDPGFAKKVRSLLTNAKENGFDLKIVSSYRDCTKQNALYRIGRRGIAGEKTITGAKCGQSAHNHKLAVDVGVWKDGRKLGRYTDRSLWRELGEIGTKMGLEWGGNWPSFYDPVHFGDPKWRKLERNLT